MLAHPLHLRMCYRGQAGEAQGSASKVLMLKHGVREMEVFTVALSRAAHLNNNNNNTFYFSGHCTVYTIKPVKNSNRIKHRTRTTLR